MTPGGNLANLNKREGRWHVNALGEKMTTCCIDIEKCPVLQSWARRCLAEKIHWEGRRHCDALKEKAASDVLAGLVMKYKGKPAEFILKLIKTDPKVSDLFAAEMQEMNIDDSEMLSYIEDSQMLYGRTSEGNNLANMYQPPSIGNMNK